MSTSGDVSADVAAEAARSHATVERAIARYHDLLGQDAMAADTQAALDEQQRLRGLSFGIKPLSTVLRPRFMTADEQRRIQRQTRALLGAFARAGAAGVADAGVRAQFRLEPWEEQLVGHDPGFAATSPTSRLDAFVMPATGALAITEYNGETPAGAAYVDNIADVFTGLPAMRAFSHEYQAIAPPARPGVLRALLDSYTQWSGGGKTPSVVILDWKEVPTYSEFVLFDDYFRSRGIPCMIGDPRDCEYRDGALYCAGTKVDLIYKRVLLSELVAREGIDGPVVRAVLGNAACMVNPFRCKMLHKKASLAVLSDERNAHLYSADQRAAIAAHVPWTRVLEDRATTHDGERIDLLSWVAAHRQRLVLKPNDEYGGVGIVLGWELGDHDWEVAMRVALASPHIVQERVSIPSEPYPSFAAGALHVFDRMVDTAPFVCNGEYAEGMLTRLSTAALLNVTAGGGSTVPTFVIEPRA